MVFFKIPSRSMFIMTFHLKDSYLWNSSKHLNFGFFSFYVNLYIKHINSNIIVISFLNIVRGVYSREIFINISKKVFHSELSHIKQWAKCYKLMFCFNNQKFNYYSSISFKIYWYIKNLRWILLIYIL